MSSLFSAFVVRVVGVCCLGGVFSMFIPALSLAEEPIGEFLQPAPALPEAEGFGSDTVAGSGGEWCLVTNLENSGSGSLRDCVDRPGPREVYFQVSGTIRLDSTLELRNPYLTIDGSTAPGGGILLTVDKAIDGPVVRVATHDVLIQHIRVRAGEAYMPTCCRDALSVGSDVPGQVYNVVVNHNSLSWGTDEVVEIVGDSHDITFSYNIISEGLHRSNASGGAAGRGMLILEHAHSISLHHNIFAHNYQRNPAIYGADNIDMVNNVIYHWVSRGAEIIPRNNPTNMNVVNNVFIAQNQNQEEPTHVNWYDIHMSDPLGIGMSVYFSGNRGHWRTHDGQPEHSLVGTDWGVPYREYLDWHSRSRHPFPAVTARSVEDLEEYLLQYAGATVPKRDQADERLIEEIIGRYGRLKDCVDGCDNNVSGFPDIY